MDDGPGLVEATDQGAVLVGRPALVVVAPQADVAVGHREQRLGTLKVRLGEAALDQPPLVERVVVARQSCRLSSHRTCSRAMGSTVSAILSVTSSTILLTLR